MIRAQEEANREQQEIIGRLQDDIKLLKRALFGNRRERFTADDPDQLYLFASNGDSHEDPENSKNEADDKDESNSKRTSRGRKVRIFPEFFPRQRHLIFSAL